MRSLHLRSAFIWLLVDITVSSAASSSSLPSCVFLSLFPFIHCSFLCTHDYLHASSSSSSFSPLSVSYSSFFPLSVSYSSFFPLSVSYSSFFPLSVSYSYCLFLTNFSRCRLFILPPTSVSLSLTLSLSLTDSLFPSLPVFVFLLFVPLSMCSSSCVPFPLHSFRRLL